MLSKFQDVTPNTSTDAPVLLLSQERWDHSVSAPGRVVPAFSQKHGDVEVENANVGLPVSVQTLACQPLRTKSSNALTGS